MEQLTADLTADDAQHLDAIVRDYACGPPGIELSRADAVRVAVREFAARCRHSSADGTHRHEPGPQHTPPRHSTSSSTTWTGQRRRVSLAGQDGRVPVRGRALHRRTSAARAHYEIRKPDRHVQRQRLTRPDGELSRSRDVAHRIVLAAGGGLSLTSSHRVTRARPSTLTLRATTVVTPRLRRDSISAHRGCAARCRVRTPRARRAAPLRGGARRPRPGRRRRSGTRGRPPSRNHRCRNT